MMETSTLTIATKAGFAAEEQFLVTDNLSSKPSDVVGSVLSKGWSKSRTQRVSSTTQSELESAKLLAG